VASGLVECVRDIDVHKRIIRSRYPFSLALPFFSRVTFFAIVTIHHVIISSSHHRSFHLHTFPILSSISRPFLFPSPQFILNLHFLHTDRASSSTKCDAQTADSAFRCPAARERTLGKE
jgi:hypothetical protein